MINTNVQLNKEINLPYERFLSFVLLTLLFRIIPFIIEATPNNIFIRLSIGAVLVFAFIFFNSNNSKIASKLRELCNSIRLKLSTLVIVYLILYLLIFSMQ